MALIVERSEMQTPIGILPLRYATIAEGRGYQCHAGNCGLCCVMEKGQGKGKTAYLGGVEKCSEFNHQTKLCNSYNLRPVLCRMFPFFSSANLNELIISPSLACPYVKQDESIFGLRDFEEMLRENNMVADICNRYLKATSMYDKSQQELQAPIRAIIFIKKVVLYPPPVEKITEIIRNKFKELASNPNVLSSIVESLNCQIFEDCRYEPENYKQKFVEEIRKIPYPSLERIIELLFKRQAGLTSSYITSATSSSNPSIMEYYRKGGRIFFKDIFTSRKWELNIKDCLMPFEMERTAREMMADYLNLLVERNYLIQSRIYPAGNMLQKYISFFASLAQMLIAATATISSKHQASIISKEIMREALAMTDARACLTIYW